MADAAGRLRLGKEIDETERQVLAIDLANTLAEYLDYGHLFRQARGTHRGGVPAAGQRATRAVARPAGVGAGTRGGGCPDRVGTTAAGAGYRPGAVVHRLRSVIAPGAMAAAADRRPTAQTSGAGHLQPRLAHAGRQFEVAADRQPDLLEWFAVLDRLRGRPSAQPRRNMVPGDRVGISRSELRVHLIPELGHPHRFEPTTAAKARPPETPSRLPRAAWHHQGMDVLGDYDLLWQLVTAVVLIGALVFLILAYRRRNDRD